MSTEAREIEPDLRSVDAWSAFPSLSALAAHALLDRAIARFDATRNANGSIPTAELRLEMQKTMQADAAVFRAEETLAAGEKKMTAIAGKMGDLHVTDRSMVIDIHGRSDEMGYRTARRIRELQRDVETQIVDGNNASVVQGAAAPLLVVAILALMVLPIPAWMLDAFFTLNVQDRKSVV